jgi:hypothetical protein
MSVRASLRFALAALALAGAPLGAQPQPTRLAPVGPNPNWVEVNQTGQARGYVDRNSIRRENGIVRFLGRMVFTAANEYGMVEVIHIGAIDCARRQFRLEVFDSFGEGGRPILSHTNSLEDYPWEALGAGSPNDNLHREHC